MGYLENSERKVITKSPIYLGGEASRCIIRQMKYLHNWHINIKFR